MSPPDYDMALVYHAIHLELSDRIGYLAMKSRALNCLGKIYTGLNFKYYKLSHTRSWSMEK